MAESKESDDDEISMDIDPEIISDRTEDESELQIGDQTQQGDEILVLDKPQTIVGPEVIGQSQAVADPGMTQVVSDVIYSTATHECMTSARDGKTDDLYDIQTNDSTQSARKRKIQYRCGNKKRLCKIKINLIQSKSKTVKSKIIRSAITQSREKCVRVKINDNSSDVDRRQTNKSTFESKYTQVDFNALTKPINPRLYKLKIHSPECINKQLNESERNSDVCMESYNKSKLIITVCKETQTELMTSDTPMYSETSELVNANITSEVYVEPGFIGHENNNLPDEFRLNESNFFIPQCNQRYCDPKLNTPMDELKVSELDKEIWEDPEEQACLFDSHNNEHNQKRATVITTAMYNKSPANEFKIPSPMSAQIVDCIRNAEVTNENRPTIIKCTRSNENKTPSKVCIEEEKVKSDINKSEDSEPERKIEMCKEIRVNKNVITSEISSENQDNISGVKKDVSHKSEHKPKICNETGVKPRGKPTRPYNAVNRLDILKNEVPYVSKPSRFTLNRLKDPPGVWKQKLPVAQPTMNSAECKSKWATAKSNVAYKSSEYNKWAATLDTELLKEVPTIDSSFNIPKVLNVESNVEVWDKFVIKSNAYNRLLTNDSIPMWYRSDSSLNAKIDAVISATTYDQRRNYDAVTGWNWKPADTNSPIWNQPSAHEHAFECLEPIVDIIESDDPLMLNAYPVFNTVNVAAGCGGTMIVRGPQAQEETLDTL